MPAERNLVPYNKLQTVAFTQTSQNTKIQNSKFDRIKFRVFAVRISVSKI
ncbi:hypothetical protein CAMRE0001_1199 [Campylobacter rectus RM3267]|uniref:Uncharacterized protein n=1 Tax=Campylobacter rectus RM3267 TaxID=553218 RepID=B9D0J5_CAMRE|nr:hypothetical protein CAMRE0001_1199 [Campylobacter rectus RM3267]